MDESLFENGQVSLAIIIIFFLLQKTKNVSHYQMLTGNQFQRWHITT